VRIPVIGVGGITDTGDALDFFVAGADAIQVGTATFVDPSASIRIVAGLTDRLARTGLSHPSELRWHHVETADC
jgi:dihydroorotate dehydrogenase (NAD+) catalytic subunit